jgi:hypothetical protein
MRLISLFFITLSLIFTSIGCSANPEGIKETRLLSGEEKAHLINLALNTEEVKQGLETRELCQITFNWVLIKWQGPHGNERTFFDYDYEKYDESRERFEEELAEGREIYAAVIIHMGNPSNNVINYGVRVLIQPDTMQIVDTSIEPLTPIN